MQIGAVQATLDTHAQHVDALGGRLSHLAMQQDVLLATAEDSSAALRGLEVSAETVQRQMAESAAAHAELQV